jgi:glycosyltransferase 2 family protein
MAELQTGSAADLTAAPPKNRSSWWMTWLKLGLSVVAIAGVAMTANLAEAWHRILNQDIRFLLVAAAILLAQLAIGGVRWCVILRGLGAPAEIGMTVRVFYMSAFFNTWMWGAVGGDILRAWLSHRAKFGLSAAVNSVILDRVSALAAVAILLLATAPTFAAHTGQTALVLILSALAVGGLLGIAVVGCLHYVPIDWHRHRLLRGLHALSNAAHMIFLRPVTTLQVLALAVSAQIAGSLAAYLTALGLKINLSLLDCIVVMQPIALVTALPISVGGWGVRETAMIGLLALIGISSSAALSLSVQIGLLTNLITLPGVVTWLCHKDIGRLNQPELQ